jgi:hypothetical protein
MLDGIVLGTLLGLLLAIAYVARVSSEEQSKNRKSEREDETEKGKPAPAITGKKDGNRPYKKSSREGDSRERRWQLDAVGIFTGLLTLVAGVQCWAFVQSERAAIAIEAVSFEGGELAGQQAPFPYSSV